MRCSAPATRCPPECAYELIDAQIERDTEAGKSIANKYVGKLQHVIDAYASPAWAVAALTRQGSLFEAARRTSAPAKRDYADASAVHAYASAVATASCSGIGGPIVKRARERLAWFAAVLGDDKVRKYMAGLADCPGTLSFGRRRHP